MTTRNAIYYYNQGVDQYERKDFAKAISSLNKFIDEADSKKNKDFALAHRYVEYLNYYLHDLTFTHQAFEKASKMCLK